jgi:nucleoid-associated protein YgaU
MSLTAKYQQVIEIAQAYSKTIQVFDEGETLRIEGSVRTENERASLEEEAKKIDPQGSDLLLRIDVRPEEVDEAEKYTIKSGDTLVLIGQRFGMPWREIWEANKDVAPNPDRIAIGTKLVIPRKGSGAAGGDGGGAASA